MNHRRSCSQSRQSRRDFLKTTTLAAVGAAAAPMITSQKAIAAGRSNAMPGRIVMYHDPNLDGHETYINGDCVEATVHNGVKLLTGIADTAAAFESLLPGLSSASQIVIKVNCIGPCDTRWETARGIVSGLSLMLGKTYDVSQVTIFDCHPLPSHGYDPAQFTFNGQCPLISSSTNAGSYYIWPGRRLSQYIEDCDYVINVPVLKSHSFVEHQTTGAIKNHYGSCYPSNLCHNIPAMLGINADPHIKDKTALIVMDAIRATYHGSPIDPPMYWEIFAPEGTPNALWFSTDPTTTDYWERDLINEERTSRGWSLKYCPWIESSSGDPYYLGISNPDEMTVVRYDPAMTIGDNEPISHESIARFERCQPNPMTASATLHFHLSRSERIVLRITDASGRIMRDLVEGEFPAGSNARHWDGRDRRGRPVPTGTYFARLQVANEVQTRRIVVMR